MAEALACFQQYLEQVGPDDPQRRQVHAMCVQCLQDLGQPAAALAACQEAVRVCPQAAELRFMEATLRRDQGDGAGAAACWQELLAADTAGNVVLGEAGLRRYHVRQNLAIHYRDQGQLAEAESEWGAVVAERPDFVPAWSGLGDVYLGQRRWSELETAATRLDTLPNGRSAGARLRADAEAARATPPGG